MNGLSSKEVLDSRKLHGSNKLPELKMKKWYDFAKEALSEKITMILIAIAVLQLFLGFMGVMELSDPIMILVVLAIVTVIAVKTGLGVQKSAAELRAKTSVRYCDVIRDGKVQTINKDELLMSIRNGEYLDGNRQPIPEFFEMVDDYEKKMKYAKENTDLPEKPDYKAIQEFVMDVNERVVRGLI